MKLTPYQRIMRAAEKGVGVRLSASEAWEMSRDTAIETRAYLDDDPIIEAQEREAAIAEARKNRGFTP